MMQRTDELPHAVRLVLFPSQGSEMLRWQFSELHYARGYPQVGHQDGGTIFAPANLASVYERLDCLLIVSKHLRSSY